MEKSAIIASVRFKQKDNNEVKFSDYDIEQSLEEALRYLNQSYALRNSDFLEKLKEYRKEEQEEFSLPDDFISLVSISHPETGYMLHPCNAHVKPKWNEYKIVGGKIYTEKDIDMMYRCKVTLEVLPDIFFDILVKLTGLILNNAETDIMREAVDDLVSELVPARRYSNRIIMPIWKV